MNLYKLLTASLLFFSSLSMRAQHFVDDNGISPGLHVQYAGHIVFMEKPVSPADFRKTDFLQEFRPDTQQDLNLGLFLERSLLNYLHELAPGLSATELAAKGNFRFTFIVDGQPLYTEDLHPRAGTPEQKQKLTCWRIPLLSSSNEDSWGRFLWMRFMFNGGMEAFYRETHELRIEIRPYIRSPELKSGPLLASGTIRMVFTQPPLSEKQLAVQAIAAGSGWGLSRAGYDSAQVRQLNRNIARGAFRDITSVVVIADGKLLLEEYFSDSSRSSLHDTRSVGKSFTSALMGMAIRKGYIRDEKQALGSFYDLYKFDNYTQKKDSISIHDLLSMSSGFYGSDMDEDSPGNEEQMYPAADWVKFALDLPLDTAKRRGTDWDYFTAGVVVLGDILQRSLPGGLERFANRELFKPLVIKDYQWQYTPQGVVSTAGGLRLRSLDLARFGQLYKDGGTYKGRRLLPEEWVRKSLSSQVTLPYSDEESYGYLFWNKCFDMNGTSYQVSYASGNGGNKIFIFRDQPWVIVLTSTAYNTPYGHAQADRIIQHYLLPALGNSR